VYFQLLDDKRECPGIYSDGSLSYDNPSPGPESNLRTWRYSPALKDLPVEYAQLYCGGRSLSSVCPEDLKNDYELISSKLRAFLRSFGESKINLSDNCFFELVPERFLLEFCEIKNEITKFVFENFFRPKNYRFLAAAQELLAEIGTQRLNIDESYMSSKLGDIRARNFLRKLRNADQHVDYDLFGTKTGRLSTKKGSFPLMTLNKDYRGVLKPNNDVFVELDYNAAELRTLLSLCGKTQPETDIHQWNCDNIYGPGVTRDEAKKRIFAWLYNPNSKDRASESFYDRDKILTDYWQGGIINTPLGRNIEVEKSKALNYLIQSTTSDAFLSQSIEISKKLSDQKSHVAFLLHDSIVLDYSLDEKDLIPELVETFSNTKLGKYKVNVSAGRNYGDMKRLSIDG